MDLEQLQQQYALVAKEWNEKKSAVVYKYLDIINVLCDAHWDKIKRADSTTRNQLEQQHEREEQELHEKQRDEERLLQELYEPRIHTIVDRMIALSAQDQTVSPYWRVRILSSKKSLLHHCKIYFRSSKCIARPN